MKSQPETTSKNRDNRLDDYEEKDEIEHILLRPDMYVGTRRLKKSLKYVVVEKEDGISIRPKNIVISEAFAKVFMEILSNAVDNVPRSINNKTPCRKIKVNFDLKTGETSVWNDGKCIPIGQKKNGDYVHTIIFGKLRAGSNFDDSQEREGVGRNGHGAKLCLKKGTIIPTYNGDTVRVEDIREGDVLVGDDGRPRNVTATCKGVGRLYKVIQDHGSSYTVNENHLITVKVVGHKDIYWDDYINAWCSIVIDHKSNTIQKKCVEVPCEDFSEKEVTKARCCLEEILSRYPDDNVLDISIRDYLKCNRYVKSQFQGVIGRCVDWPYEKVELDPYILGIWLGDGYKNGYGFNLNHESNPQIVEYINGCDFSTCMKDVLSTYDLVNNKHIPRKYLVNCKETRMALLAGLIDSSACETTLGGYITISGAKISGKLGSDIMFLARSLGFLATSNVKKSRKLDSDVTVSTCRGIVITGVNLKELPIKVSSKMLSSRYEELFQVTTGKLRVKKQDVDEYIGVEVDGNHRFVLQDFTVTHNCNVYSKNFTVEGVDPHVGKKFVQRWSNNMRDREDPKITSSSLKTGYTCVSWTPDFEVFGMKGYTKDILSLLKKYVVDVAMTTRVPVYLNGERIPVNNLLDYAKLYVEADSEDVDAEDAESSVQEKGNEKVYLDSKTHEIVLLPNYDTAEYRSISFVNGAYTPNDGVHVDAWSEEIFRPMVDKINKKNTTTKNGKTESSRPQINIKDVKQFFYLFTSVKVPNPEFESQSKTRLEGPEVKAVFPASKINSIMKWSTSEMIDNIINTRELTQLKKITSVKRRVTKIDKLTSANNEGTKKSHECILIVCEGDSAKTYGTTGIDVGVLGKKGRDFFGIYPLRGKILNVKKANFKQILANKVVMDLINALGLRYDVDYTDDKEYRTLRYGTLMTLTDADVDGFHILGLVLNVIHGLFPSLFKRDKPFVVHMCTPIAKVLDLKDKVFFDEREYNNFMTETGNKHKSKYYKGLGTSSRTEVKETFGQKIIEFVSSRDIDTSMEKVFNDGRVYTNKRKKWLDEYDPDSYKNFDNGKGVSQLTVSNFLNHYMIQFGIHACERAIPHLMDGLKVVNRKIIYGCFKRKLKTDIKVASLAGYLTEHTKYHHGETSLQEAIKGMASCFTGGNNLPLLVRSGEMGSRLQGGKDSASARYVETHLDEIARMVFSEYDDCLLENVIDDGTVVEPKFYVPCIPMALVNPCSGIGEGWSTSIPGFNPLDLSKCVKMWLENDGCSVNDDGDSIFPALVPWYRGFKGVIERVSEDKFISHGIIERTGDRKVVVRELPVGYWTEKFESRLQDLKVDKKIKGFRVGYTVCDVYFEIDEIEGGIVCDEDSLKLTKLLSISNIVLFDENKTLQKFSSVDEIIDRFCRIKYSYIIKRKRTMLKDYKLNLDLNKNKKRFIEDIISKKLEVFMRDEANVVRDMEDDGFMKYYRGSEEGGRSSGYEYLLQMHMRSFTSNKIKEIEKEMTRLSGLINTLKNTSERRLWMNDLDAFENSYRSMLIRLEEELNHKESGKPKKTKTKKK